MLYSLNTCKNSKKKMLKKNELHIIKDRLRKGFNKYTRRAYETLSGIKNPHILDIGCGSGVPTMELALLSGGYVTGIDIDRTALDELTEKIERAGLSGRMNAVNCSAASLNFPDGSYDIVWAEGAIATIGFEKGLKEWKRLTKPGGFLVIHDDKGDLSQKIIQVSECGYKLIDHFIIKGNEWWSGLYKPLGEAIKEIRERGNPGTDVLREMDTDNNFIEIIKKNPEHYDSVFFILKKK